MNDHFQQIVLNATGAEGLTEEGELIQSLWSGYGKIIRCRLHGADVDSVVVKHVHWPDAANHPRGWNTGLSHERKVRSYQVETEFYATWAARCGAECRVPKCHALETHGDEVFMVLEDLDAAGFGDRRRTVSDEDVRACLSWLAHFHAAFMNENPDGLWPVGTYWHLATRPDELAALDDSALRNAAAAIDRRLNDARFKTFVHGDAKLANFCFSAHGNQVAAVDFQYVGGGCGMKDVAYFLGSCLNEDECEEREDELLDYYFGTLEKCMGGGSASFQALETEWRALYPVAWTDFFRFLQGWSPGHWKINSYSMRLARQVLKELA
ncbi:phosphotransferase [Tichowtungia aerotolerans]|uniref:Phosphotransferase n=1 Tax=Tichowtungia aerotolerans TaxID=2697043 RepID=A0A6P1M8Q1_9BACT|nr:phosphotransferase [Tichowtungia aerotolerans]QHI68904.1 phosphotransferase [Tichowtungia aerotolerans]